MALENCRVRGTFLALLGEDLYRECGGNHQAEADNMEGPSWRKRGGRVCRGIIAKCIGPQKLGEKGIDSGSWDREGLIFQLDCKGPTFSLEHLSSCGKTAFSSARQLSRCDKDSV